MARESNELSVRGAKPIARDVSRATLDSLRGTPLRSLLIATAAVVALTVVMLPFREQLGVLNVLLLYLMLTLLVALVTGLWPAVVCAVLGFLAFDFLFIPPYFTLSVARLDHVLTLFVYLGVAIVTAHLVSRVRARTDEAERETRRTALLAELNAALIGGVTLDAILARIAESVVTVYGAEGCRVLLPDADGALRGRAYYPQAMGPYLDRTELSLVDWAVAQRRAIGRSGRGRRIVGPRRDQPREPIVPGGSKRPDVLYLPIQTATQVLGVLEVIGRPGTGAFRPEDESLLSTFVDQAALALERARLSEEAAQVEALAKSDELKSALLAAVSHELRTPLASIKASATSLLDDSVEWDAATRKEFLSAIDEETDRLTLMVSNLLDLSRIEGGALRPQRDWYDIDELVADVRARLSSRLESHPISVVIEPNLPSLPFDYVEIAQVLINLIENAVKYTPAGTAITIAAKRVPGAIQVAVHDDGPGIPAPAQSHLFEKFYRAPSATGAPGTGIGLTISKGLVEANGGQIEMESDPGQGTTFRFTVPLAVEAEGRVPSGRRKAEDGTPITDAAHTNPPASRLSPPASGAAA